MSEATIFAAALDLVDPAERAAYLAEACAGDDRLRRRVEALLNVHSEPDDILDVPVPGMPTADFPGISERPGTMIGPYKLMEKIGEGGFGLVFVAEQTEPVKRKVAVKVIKPGMDSKQVIARFEAERQALAMMDHPNIARVLDAGTTEAGRPYFVMELVRGIPITDYCDQNHLTPAERLELFVSVCHAIQHAHQKGIIHRDIKPSNVLVTSHDGKPVAKVIDFGVAKAIHQHLTERTIYTQFAQMIGTPLYMSPEQAEMSGLDIDTRSDIYSLGVLLYELLTGSTPLERKRLAQAAYDEIRRAIREDEAQRPSDRLSTSDTLPSLAASRKTEPARLSRMLKGELDWIVLKALEKDRTRRYETANGFARDIQRYLSDEVVEARPASAGYRLRKLVSRNKGRVLAASLVLLALLAGIAVSTWQAIRATRAEHLALAARQAEVERAEGERLAKLAAEANEKLAGERLVQVESEKKKANEEKQIAQSVRDFLEGKLLAQTDTKKQADALLRAGESSSEAKLNPTIRELLDRAARELAPDKIEASFPKQPLIQAEILKTIGDTYRGIGEAQLAIDFLKRSETLRRQHLGPDHHDTLDTMNSLAATFSNAAKWTTAVELYKELLKLNKAKLGPDHSLTLASMHGLAIAYLNVEKIDLALPLFEESLKLVKAKLGFDHPETLWSMHCLATAYQSASKIDSALPLFEEAFRLQKSKLGPEHPDTLATMNNLAVSYRSILKWDRALPLFEEVFNLRKAKLGPEHPATLITMHNLASAYQDTGKWDVAIPLFEETVKLKNVRFGPEHPETLRSMNNLGMAYRTVGKLDKALLLFKEMLVHGRKTLSQDSLQLATQLASYGLTLLQTNAFIEAESLLRESLVIREKQEPDDWRTLNTKSMLGGALLGQKKYDEAEPLLLKGYEGMKQREKTIPPQGSTRIPEALDRLIQFYTETNKPDEVKKWQAEKDKLPKVVEKKL